MEVSMAPTVNACGVLLQPKGTHCSPITRFDVQIEVVYVLAVPVAKLARSLASCVPLTLKGRLVGMNV
jgi:hypothetical protein